MIRVEEAWAEACPVECKEVAWALNDTKANKDHNDLRQDGKDQVADKAAEIGEKVLRIYCSRWTYSGVRASQFHGESCFYPKWHQIKGDSLGRNNVDNVDVSFNNDACN